MNILITGGNGFIASHLIKQLHQTFNITISIRKPIEQNNNIKQIISSNFIEYDWHKDLQDIDIVIHTISLNHSKDNSWSRYYETNYLITQNLLKFLPKSNVKKFFYLSTIKVHGEYFKINHILEKNIETKPYDFYGKSKLITENLIKEEISKINDIEYCIFRLPMVYGKKKELNLTKLIFFIKKKIPYLIPNTENKRSILSINNFCSQINVILNSKKKLDDIFYLKDEDDYSFCDLKSDIIKSLNIKDYSIKINHKILLFIFICFGKKNLFNKLFGNAVVSFQRTKNYFNLIEKYHYKNEIREICNYYFK